MADPVQNAEDNLQQYLRQQMLGQQRVRTEADFPAAVEARLAETADAINYQLGPSAPPFAAEAARSVIDKNTDDMIDYYNFLQFEQDPSNILERRAIDEAVYTGKVPFGYEDSNYLYTQGSKGVLGNSLIPEVAERLGISRDINVAGNQAAFSQVPIHEGMHPLVKLPKKEEEAALRALDYFRMKRYGNSAEAQKLLEEAGYDVTRPFGLGNARVLALKGAMSMTDDQFQDLSDVDRAELQESFDAYKQAPGLISSVLGSLTGEEPQPEFDNMIITPEKAAEMSEEDFNTLLKAAPAFTFERAFSRSIDITGPRMIGEGDSAVRAYENGGGIGYFERPEGEYGVEPSQFEQDVTQQPGRVYDTIFTPMSRAESVQHPLYGASEEPYEFDPAGGIMGMAGRALSTFDRKLSGLPVSDEQLAGAAMDIVPTSAGIASTAFGPAMLPGMLGAFSMKHGSGRLFNFFARNPKSTSDYTLLRERTAGPGTYLGDEEVAVGYARRFAERDFAGEEDVAYDVAFPFGVDIEDMRANPKKYDPDVIDDPKLREDTDRALSDVLEDANRRAESKVVDMDNGKIMYFFEDGSTLVRNLNPTQDGRPVIEPLGKGAGFVYDVMVNAEKEHFLDFSKPLFKQPDFVASKIQDLRRLVELDDKATGSQFYGKLKQKLGGEEEATKALIDLGIIGNRFEQRGKEMMVVFDPDNLSIEKTTPYERFADGGVVSLKDKAVNMTRGPRSNGIMQYVPYMTGATNGY